VDVFLRAVASVARDRPNVAALVVGGALYGRDHEYAEGLPHLASQLGLGDRVMFTGHREDALSLIAACDVVVHASLEPEPLGMVVPEAMALGRAVIASRTGGPEEVVEDGATGLLVSPGDERELAGAIAALVDNPGERSRLGTAGRDAVRRYWSASRMASDFADLYRSLVVSSS
jgi:glycosyltransferase involved in cell wall biosynthesis